MFALSHASKTRLETTHPILQRVVREAIKKTPIDFGVSCGVRTEQEQKDLMDAGATHTLKSKHLKQEDGFAHAVDLVAYINGRVCWELKPYLRIAKAMQIAGYDFKHDFQHHGFTMRWGGAWQETDFFNSADEPDILQKKYIQQRLNLGQDPFIDAPHFELVKVQ